ncbi:hypothetical protein IMCC3317_14660 [Kordia antarctica]|uniref:Lipoprotein n=1 Tax=Kordia antarctica TaxID=1218801 RepID=A0A7L4ZHL2_9FLAO|nr:hypothetical protein [Kordia antarctica]QHI36112.1 hypothetical protein IMCC3317_14660 [Kordia antarctica]
MRKIAFLFVLALTFFSCDDGDLTLDEIDLTTSADIDACTIEAGVTLLFKINGAETLILEIPTDLIVNEVTVTDTPRTKTLNSQAFCYYRSFDTTITTNYFCDQLPSDVNSTLEYIAVAGEVQVTTVEVLNGTTLEGYEHTINFSEVVFTGTNGQDVRYDFFVFGTLVTPL